MILGKLDVAALSLVGINQHAANAYSLPRFYCGPHNLNVMAETLEVLMPLPWRAVITEQVLELVGKQWPSHSDVRETVICACGPGNANKVFRMRNYLDRGIRVHVALTNGGKFVGPRTIEYGIGDVIAFDANDSGHTWRHEYDQRCLQLVLVVLSKADAGKSNWRLFAEHNKEQRT